MDIEAIVQELTSARQELRRVSSHLSTLQNTFIGLARILNIDPDLLVDAMISAKSNEEYEADVLAAFTKRTGRVSSGADGIIEQEIKKNKKK